MGFIDETKKILDIKKEDISRTCCYICPNKGGMLNCPKKHYRYPL